MRLSRGRHRAVLPPSGWLYALASHQSSYTTHFLAAEQTEEPDPYLLNCCASKFSDCCKLD